MTKTTAAGRQSHIWIKDIKEKDILKSSYLVKRKKTGTTRNGNFFLSLSLGDRTGEVEAKVWDRAEALSASFGEGDVLEVDAVAGSYRGKLQLTVSDIKVSEKKADPDLFMETAPVDIAEMFASLREILGGLREPHLKSLIESFLCDQQFLLVFKQAPAAKNFHHNYIGGLLEHTLSVCRLAVQVASHYPQLDGDLLVTSAFLHDIGKIKEFKFGLVVDYTDEGRLLGHLVLGAAMVDEKIGKLKSFPRESAILLKHLILSHHGQYEFGSPKRPKILEAFALHLIDDLDAKINGLGRFMEKDRQEGPWTDYNRLFERYFLKGKISEFEKKMDDTGHIEDERQGTLF